MMPKLSNYKAISTVEDAKQFRSQSANVQMQGQGQQIINLDEEFDKVMAKNVTPMRPVPPEPKPKIKIYKAKVKRQGSRKKFVNIGSIEKEIEKINRI